MVVILATLLTPLVYAIFGVHPLSTLTYCLFTIVAVCLTCGIDWIIGFIFYYILVIQIALCFIPLKGLEGTERIAAPVFICITAAVAYVLCFGVRRASQFLRQSTSASGKK
ncbi:MAG: hypothetical protein JNJ77_13370 [Planctomycetia bacterium]|nr:hypothetical protein [Planctomycetia bacterium]